ncbi:tubby protein homolog 1-like [Pygocentrus nattereri]|uniref:tubby protein homolog 1-like n=1 Tax=Pygocentrus nattereri TaxID=42514 RepID=UPI0018918752|nr:tubby protein homolog 1-like [Pygocentrus nattereri]
MKTTLHSTTASPCALCKPSPSPCPASSDTASTPSTRPPSTPLSPKHLQPSLDTKEPEKKKQKAYVLDLNGRVKKGAVQNFQLACPANPDEKVIQFGRVDEDHFLQDCSFHLCTLQAFAITSTSDLNTVYTCTVHTHVPITSSPFNKNNKTREEYFLMDMMSVQVYQVPGCF